MNLRYTSQAQIDIDVAIGWYENQRTGLGLEFLDCVMTTIKLILENPAIYPRKHKKLRAALIRKFPFTIFYVASEAEVIIYAVFDNRQDPIKKP